MSFILDALRKSETERQKANVPGIGDAPLVVRQKHVPRWTVGLIACLSGCLVVLGWFWLRDTGIETVRDVTGLGPSSAQTTASGTASPPRTAADDTASSVPSADVSSAPSADAASSVPSADGGAASSVPLVVPVAAMTPIARTDGEVRDLSAEARQTTVAPGPASAGSPTAQAAAAMPETFAAPMLTLAQYRASGGTLPELNLELHVYSPAAAERFVFINSSKYVEGQTLSEGPRLGTITEGGAVLIHQGRSLLLPRE